MKIRMKDNSLRLRLTQSEVELFRREGKVSSASRLGPLPHQIIRYGLLTDKNSTSVSVRYEPNNIQVLVPEMEANSWTTTNQVGFEAYMPLEKGDQLFILIEKDFQCLQERPHEDESDAFPNPLMGLPETNC